MKKFNSVKEVKEAMNRNANFREYMLEELYDYSMCYQQSLYDDAGIEGLECHNHYSSFFYTIRDRKAFLQSYYDYYGNEELAYLLEKENTLYLMDYNNPNYDLLDAWLDEKATFYMKDWENELKYYENEYNDLEENGLGYCIIQTMLECEDIILEDYYLSEIYEEEPILYKKENDNFIRV